MTLSQLNRIASKQAAEPDLPGVHSTGMVSKMPPEAQKSLFDQMRAAVGPMGDEEFELLDQQCQSALGKVTDLENQLLKANAEFDRLNALRAVEINRRLDAQKPLT